MPAQPSVPDPSRACENGADAQKYLGHQELLCSVLDLVFDVATSRLVSAR